MCGIVGYTGKRNAANVVIVGLERLEYRGYDSAGMAVMEADRIGISTLSRAGYDPAGMGEFFEKMGRITRAMGEGPPE